MEKSQMKNLKTQTNLYRRQLLQLLAAGAAAGSSAGIAASEAAAEAPVGHGMNKLLELTASEAIAVMRSGELRAETYAAVLLARSRSLRHLNALLSQNETHVRMAAHAADELRDCGKTPGRLHGLPILIKASINTTAFPTSAGTKSLINNRPRRNALVVERLLNEGAILFGETNMHELAAGVTSNNFAFGPVRNPYDPTKIPGGSSGGAACAVAARMAPASLGTDTAGSVRIPAALCGIVGL